MPQTAESIHPKKGYSDIALFPLCQGYVKKEEDASHNITISRQTDFDSTINLFEKRLEISHFTIEWLYKLVADTEKNAHKTKRSNFP